MFPKDTRKTFDSTFCDYIENIKDAQKEESVAEWFIASALKTEVPSNGTVVLNLSLRQSKNLSSKGTKIIMKILLGTTNNKKIQDFTSYDFFRQQTFVTLSDVETTEPEETEEDLKGNALLKARHYFQQTGLPTLSDDTGFFIHALGGFPGVHSARIAGVSRDFQKAKQLVAEKLEPYRDKSATFSTALAYVDEERQYVVQGDVVGDFIFPPRTEKIDNDGYRDVFWLHDLRKPFSELSREEWKLNSSRGRAIQQWLNFAKSEGLVV
ncbi:MAG: non-canonical purine NTP pyrophosphatase [Puniceicoccales bacterium]|nr:non-canonical purine NTP pyrophosphatase [Puniceicoccales bacterium]